MSPPADLRPLQAHLRLTLLCCCVFLIALAAPVRAENSDPWGALLVSQALLERGTVSIEAYPEAADLNYRLAARDDRLYYNYPLGTSLAALPAVWLANRFGFDMAQAPYEHFVQDLLSALTVATVCALFYALAAPFVGRRSALLLAFVFTLGTSVASTMGTALWSFNLTMLCTLTALLLLVRSGAAGPTLQRAALIGLLIVFAYIARPTALAPAAAIGGYLAVNRHWKALSALGGAAALAVLSFGLFSWLQYGVPIPPYYQGSRDEGFGLDLSRLPASFYGLFFSPGRGLLSFTPFLLLPIAALIAWPRLWRQPLVWLILIWFGMHSAAMLSWRHWWGGASFGPRLFTDALPALFLLTVLVWRAAAERGMLFQRVAGAVFGALAGLSIGVHTAQGLYAPYSQNYHFVGYHTIDVLPAALFDWRYPQFLSTPQRWVARQQIYSADPPLPNTLWGQPVFGVPYLRSDPDWRPEHVDLSPNIALRFNGPLMVYEESFAARLFNDREQFWIASNGEQLATLRFALQPFEQPAILVLTVNDAAPITVDTAARPHVTVYLRLRQGVNRINLELAPCPACTPAEPAPAQRTAAIRDLRVTTHQP
jgi:hypothetical protein